MNPSPGQVWTFENDVLPPPRRKRKHHLCVGDDLFLFLSTPRRDSAEDLLLRNEELKPLKPTWNGFSALSFNPLMLRNAAARMPASFRCEVRKAVMASIYVAIRRSPKVSEYDFDMISEGLLDHFGLDLPRFAADLPSR